MTENIDYRAWAFWLQFAQVVGYLILGVWVWISNRRKATVAEIMAVRTELQQVKNMQSDKCNIHQERTTKIEEAMKTAPTHNDLGQMYERINSVKGTVDEMSGTLKAVNRQLGLLVEHHLRGGKK